MSAEVRRQLLVEVVGKHPEILVGDSAFPQLVLEEGDPVPRTYEPIDPSVPDGARWEVTINGEKVLIPISEITLYNPNFATLQYGKSPDGSWGVPTFQENGGGGAVTLPVMQNPRTGSWHVGLVLEKRSNMGGLVWNVPRGFIKPGETHDEGAAREGEEEMGISRESLTRRLFKLATGVNPNSAFFDTSQSPGDGVAFYAFEMKQTELVPNVLISDNYEPFIIYSFPDMIKKAFEAGDKEAQRILGSMIVPIEVAFNSKDMFTKAVVGQFMMATLLGKFQREVLESGDPLWLPTGR